jgi:hypothetical protein
MPAKPARTHLPEWLQSRMMSDLEQAIHRQGIDPQDVQNFPSRGVCRLVRTRWLLPEFLRGLGTFAAAA